MRRWGAGTWVAQVIRRPPLGFGSDHDLVVPEFKPQVGLCADGAEPAWDSLSQNKYTKVKKKKVNRLPFPLPTQRT